MNGISRIVENLSACQADEFEMRFQSRKILGLQSGQEPVCAMICCRDLGHGDILAPFR
jgi:hypothetical protein